MNDIVFSVIFIFVHVFVWNNLLPPGPELNYNLASVFRPPGVKSWIAV